MVPFSGRELELKNLLIQYTSTKHRVIDKISKIKEVSVKNTLLRTKHGMPWRYISKLTGKKLILDVLECIKILKLSVSYLKS